MGVLVPLEKNAKTSSSTEGRGTGRECCPHCGKEKIPQTTELLGTIITITLPCSCEIQVYEKEMQRIKNYEKYQRQRQMRKNSGLDGAARELTFANFKPRPGADEALQMAREFVDKWNQRLQAGEGFTLAGTYGSGKSHLAAAVIHELIKRGVSAAYQPVAELLKRVRATYDGSARESEAQVLEWLQSVQCLALDDIGAQKQTQWAEEFIFTVLDHRYRRRLPTIITTNCTAIDGENSLSDVLGERVTDRLLERNIFVRVKATSYRREVARQRLMKAEKKNNLKDR